ncbi:MAG: hypothetical protein OXM02_02290 [Bacteroidota bacterium]|nr:hypothetical protein [Bacteroidota bacterium]MDE2956987.1 hypothetical protein [Bacteroidota bacterium]
MRTTDNGCRLWKQQHFKLLIGQPVKEGPGQPGLLGAGKIVAYGLGGQLRVTRREALAVSLAVVITQHVSDSSHSDSFLGTRSLICEKEQ